MKSTDQIVDPSWQDIHDRDKLIEQLREDIEKFKIMVGKPGSYVELKRKCVERDMCIADLKIQLEH